MFYRESNGLRIVVHGDDFLVLADSEGLQEVDDLLRSAYELKRLGTLGFEEGDDKEVHFLNIKEDKRSFLNQTGDTWIY